MKFDMLINKLGILALSTTALCSVALTAHANDNTDAEATATTVSDTSNPASEVADESNMSDATDFVKNASIGGEFEIKSSKVALKKSKNAEVRKFAQQMITDHSKASAELKTAAKSAEAKAGLTSKLDDKHQDMLDKISKADAKSFDKEYTDAQNKAHDEAVKLFTDYAETGKDADLKAFAQKTLPTLQMHQDHAKKLDGKF